MRQQTVQPNNILEGLMQDCIKVIDVDLPEDKSKLLVRLFLSALARHFFIHPDDIFNLGFVHLEKSPKKEELFTMTLIKSPKDGVVNANTLWKYYNGELLKEFKFKEIMENFFQELIDYSQDQEVEITELTSNISLKTKLEEKKRRK